MINPQQLHSRIREGDRQAEGDLAVFLRNLFRVEYQKALGPLADDYLQDLTIQIIDGVRNNKVDDPAKLIPYCRSVASNVRIDGLRSAASAARRLLPIEEGKNRQSSGNVENELILAEQLRTVWKLMEVLDPISHEIVRRYYFEWQKAPQIERAMRLKHDDFQRTKDGAVEKLRREHKLRHQDRAMAQKSRTIPVRPGLKPPLGYRELRAA